MRCAAVLAAAGLVFGVGTARATDLKGTITNTVTIIDDSQLVGDVTCAVPLTVSGPNPCIAFGTDHIKLRLNGHTITGGITPPTGCSLQTDSDFGVGILVAGRTDVEIQGPGIIQKFERWGILLRLSDHVTVRKITAVRNCWSGMQTGFVSESSFTENNWVNNAAGSNGAPCGGVCLSNSNKNVIRKSTFHGNGSVDYMGGNVDFGIGFEGTSSENSVVENDIGGNANGVDFFDSSSDNVVRHNKIVGNPAAQVIKSFTAADQQGADIAFRPDFSGANNVIEDNFCLTYIAGAGPATAPCPNLKTEGEEDEFSRLTSPAKRQPAPSDVSTAEHRVVGLVNHQR
jgi:parallel beta-helix repeat protein